MTPRLRSIAAGRAVTASALFIPGAVNYCVALAFFRCADVLQ